ncbi:hypothetical protein LptCag_1099 [Leptospirillum ferriphilum]|uniref:Uncharacterized protein n=1 Tax=Leptospirillum ferriphilum TaxID=178606 RepID=A0A094YM66_9BACT|nr:hypothetical protein LptCag_1099 [Leptospirillum ferriphilum]
MNRQNKNIHCTVFGKTYPDTEDEKSQNAKFRPSEESVKNFYNLFSDGLTKR